MKATPEGYPTAVAQFDLYKSHIFSKSEPATINVIHVAQHDAIFLLLVFLYSETKKVESQVQSDLSYPEGGNSRFVQSGGNAGVVAATAGGSG